MGTGEERQKLLAMPERAREEIIYEREQERKNRAERKRARRARLGRARRGKRRTMTREQEAQNERKKWALAQIKRKQNIKKKKKVKEDEEYQDEDEIDEDDDNEDKIDMEAEDEEDDDESEDSQDRKDEPLWSQETPLDLKTLKQCQVRRKALEKLVEKGYFEDYVKGMFVRVSIGTCPKGVPRFLCARIDSVYNSSRPYQLTNKNRTRKKVLLALGKSLKGFSINMISNQSIDQDNFIAWKKKMVADGLETEIPCCEALQYHRAEAEKFRRNFKLTPEIYRKMIREKEELGFIGNITMKKAELKSRLRTLGEDDAEEKERVLQKLKKIEMMEDQEKKNYAYTDGQMLAKINAAQAKKNAERRQIIARNKKRKRANPEASGALNPFVRRDTWSTGMVIARETKEDEEFNAKENKLKEKKPKSEKDDQAQEEKKVYMIDQILKKAVQLPHNVTSADMKESDQTRKFVEEDESWRKMRELCTVRQVTWKRLLTGRP